MTARDCITATTRADKIDQGALVRGGLPPKRGPDLVAAFGGDNHDHERRSRPCW